MFFVKKTMKKLLAVTLTLIMCLMSLPVISLAAGDGDITVDISQQRAVYEGLSNATVKILGMNFKLDFSALSEYLDVTVECIDTNGVSYYQTIDISAQSSDVVGLSFDTQAPADKVIIHFNSLYYLKADLLGTVLDMIDSEYVPSFALLSDEFGSKLFTPSEAQFVEDITASVPINLMIVNIDSEVKFKSYQYTLDICNETVTVDIADVLSIKKALDEVEDINVAGMTMDVDFTDFYDYLDVEVECIDENGSSYIKTIDVSEAESNLVDLTFSTVAPAKEYIIHFNGVEKISARVLTTNMDLLQNDQIQGFTVSSETFGTRTFVQQEAEVGEEYSGGFTLKLGILDASAEAKLKKTTYAFSIYNETITVDISAPRGMREALDNLEVRGLSFDFADFHYNLDVTVECVDTNGNSTFKVIDISEAESNLVDLTFSTTAPVRKIILHFNSIKKMSVNTLIAGYLELFTLDDLFEFAISTDVVGGKYFSQAEAQEITDYTTEFNFKVSGVSMKGSAEMQSAQYVFDYCAETVSVDVSDCKSLWNALSEIDAGSIVLDLSDLGKKASGVDVICTDINGAVSTQTIDTYTCEQDVVDLTFSMDAPIKNITVRVKAIRALDLVITSVGLDACPAVALTTRMGSRVFLPENATEGDMLSVKFKTKMMGMSMTVEAAVQNMDYSFDLSPEYYPADYDHEYDTLSFGKLYDKVSVDIYKKAYGDIKGAELYKLFENGYEHGMCFGLTAATAAFLAHPEAVASNNTYSYSAADLEMSSIPDAFGISVADFIRYAYIYQFDGDLQKAERAAMNNLSGLYEAVKAYANGNNQPVVINFFGKNAADMTDGHSVIALGYKETDDYYAVIVKDYYVDSDKQEIKIAKDFSSWTYNGISSDSSDITYLKPAEDIYTMGRNIASASAFFGADESLVTSEKAIDGDALLKSMLPLVAGSADGSDAYVYWLEDEENAAITCAENDNLVSVFTDKSLVEFVLDEDTEATVNVDLLDNSSVVLKGNGNDMGKITFTTVDEEGTETVLVIEGSDCEGTVTATKNDEGIRVSGVKDGKVTLSQEGEVVASQEITMAESDIGITLDSQAGLDVDYTAHKHSYEQTVTLAPTHISEGVMTYSCSCGDSYTEDIGVIEQHSYNASIVKPTCTQNGYTEYTCQCGDTYTETIPTTGHTYKEGETKCSECGFDKADSCSCNCHKGGFMAFIWKLINLFNKLFKINASCSCGVRHW